MPRIYSMDNELFTNMNYLPLWAYVALAIISIIYTIYDPKATRTQKQQSILLTIVWSLFWGWLIYLFCRKGDTTTAWVLFFLPFIIALLLVSGVLLALGFTR